ncbi:MAG: YdcF family protein [Acidobacteriia bacterium]|nr:YdcF family protein [Terriglobia bacterium]
MTLVKRLLETCFSPVGIMIICFAIGLLAGSRRHWRVWRRLIPAGAGLCMIWLLTPLAEVLVAHLERPFPAMLHPYASAGVRTVVVLSGYGEDYPFVPVTSRLSGETISRMVEGIRLYRELPGAKLVFSGGVVHKQDKPVASLMGDFSKTLGVPDTDIVLESRSQTTYENFVELKKIIGTTPFILVTSACDLRRATAVARRLGMRPLAAPAAIWAAQHYPAGMSWPAWAGRLAEGLVQPSTDRLVYLQRAYHEYLGYIWYWMLGRV